MSSNLETRSLLDEWRNFDEGGFFDLGHPLLIPIAQSFFKAASIGAIQAVVGEAFLVAVEGTDIAGVKNKKHGFPDLKGETNRKSLEAIVKSTGKESPQWGLAAGLYSGLTYGLRGARGAHDW